MLVEFLVGRSYSPDGVRVVTVRAGEVVDVPHPLASRLLQAGAVREVKAVVGAPENKVAATDPEPELEPVRRGRRRGGV